MSIIIQLTSIQNDSLQIGDMVYSIPSASLTTTGAMNHADDFDLVGKITDISDASITIDSPSTTPAIGDFLMFSKDKAANNTSLLGYYAEVKIENNSSDHAELFAIGSEVAPSSK